MSVKREIQKPSIQNEHKVRWCLWMGQVVWIIKFIKARGDCCARTADTDYCKFISFPMHEFPSTLGREHATPGNDVVYFSYSWFIFLKVVWKNLIHFSTYQSSKVLHTHSTLIVIFYRCSSQGSSSQNALWIGSFFFVWFLHPPASNTRPTQFMPTGDFGHWQIFRRILDIATKGCAPKQMPLVPQERSCTRKLQSIDHYNPSVSATAFFYAVCSPTT